ncbi:glycosyltransferase [Georgenia yuyongxinii]|uniref:D-inositol 3-phosphate glycosyltransferase n=1 Tax=Georgenia yuyongxinii TaxID=2589797 RepID=A0A5B8BZQ9_9MICO|nr:glycosyltransferase [Georgenia yuyongxinii]QDC23909.1 glycosyltransferase [Georgenia yuyongxinii]
MGIELTLAWVTNVASPYRLPVWEHLASGADLTVHLLESSARLLKDPGNRGPEWAVDGGQGYAIREVPTWRVTRGETQLYVARRRILPRARRVDAALLGGWESPAYWQALAEARHQGARTVGFYESTLSTNRFSGGPVARARERYFRLLDAVVVPGPAAEEAVLAMGVPERRVFTGFNAVDVRGIHAATTRLRQGAGTQPGHRFLYVGQLIDRKNVASLVRAFAAVAQPADNLEIVGTGAGRPELERLAVGLGVRDRVAFTGLVPYPQLPAVLSRNDTLVLPSTEEVWGLVVNEALAAGLHAVVSTVCGVAPSVAGMRGVHLTGASPAGLGAAMAHSRSAWRGPVLQPEILACTPERFAGVFRDALTAGR